ncbi:hypothetical protein C0J52_25102 [Blattella germanica]|nr:hypothetical protein C0J52_25102 [Blattella germanica]
MIYLVLRSQTGNLLVETYTNFHIVKILQALMESIAPMLFLWRILLQCCRFCNK